MEKIVIVRHEGGGSLALCCHLFLFPCSISEERDTYERETARLQSTLQMETGKRTEMQTHLKVTALTL